MCFLSFQMCSVQMLINTKLFPKAGAFAVEIMYVEVSKICKILYVYIPTILQTRGCFFSSCYWIHYACSFWLSGVRRLGRRCAGKENLKLLSMIH